MSNYKKKKKHIKVQVAVGINQFPDRAPHLRYEMVLYFRARSTERQCVYVQLNADHAEATAQLLGIEISRIQKTTI